MKKHTLFLIVIASLASFLSCKKDSGDTIEDYPFYFKANVNGTNVQFGADDLNSQYGCGISEPENSLGTDYDIYTGTILEDMNDPSRNSISVHFLKFFPHYPSNTERHAIVHTGPYPYGFGDVSSSTIDGASLFYLDDNGEYWYSETGPQTGSTFTVTELVDNPSGTSGKIFKATFSCKLYHESGAGSIQVNNATIRGKLFLP